MKTIITTLLILATSLVAQARIIPHWSDQELLEKSDLVVIASPTTSADTQERTDLPGLTAQKVIGIETGFAVSAVVKGDMAVKNLILHHYRADEERTGIISNGPSLIAFKPEEKRKFLLYLKRETDGRYAPTVGQVDPGMQGITALSEPVSAAPNPTTPTDVAISTPPSSLALKEPNILAAGAWSEPVAGTPDKNTTRGAHSPVIRGRLLLCVSPKNNSPAVYVELQDCGNGWVTTTEIYCDMGRGIGLGLTDTNGQPLAPKPSEFLGGGGGGGMPGADWITFPADSTIRLRVSPYASFTYHSTDDYLMSGSFVVDNPPADHTGLGVWQGTLKLPAMKIVVPKAIPKAAQVSPAATSANLPVPPEAQTVLDGLNQKAAEEPFIPASLNSLLPKITSGMTHEGMKKELEGAYPKLDTPKDASAKDVIAAYCKMSSFQDGSRIREFTVLEERTVKISGPLPDAYIAARCKTDHGPMIFLLQYQEKPGQWWVKQYDAPAEQDAAGQPTTRPETKPEGNQKPQPKSEGRSR